MRLGLMVAQPANTMSGLVMTLNRQAFKWKSVMLGVVIGLQRLTLNQFRAKILSGFTVKISQ